MWSLVILILISSNKNYPSPRKINKPTRVTSSVRIIDHTWCNSSSKVVSSDIYTNTSDRFPVNASFSVAQNRSEARMVKQARLFSSVNIEQFTAHSGDICCILAFASYDPNTIISNFKWVLKNSFSQVTNKTKEKWLYKPHITQDIGSFSKEKNKLKRKFTKTSIAFEEYLWLRSKNKAIDMLSKFYKSKLEYHSVLNFLVKWSLIRNQLMIL